VANVPDYCMDEVANHAARMRMHIERYGLERVESFLDACLSLDNLIDVHAAGIRRRPIPVDKPDEPPTVRKMPSKTYMDVFINPPQFLAEQQRQLDAAAQQHKQVPEEPEREHCSGEGEWHCEHDGQRVAKTLELRRKDQIDESER
jgi:stage V sporulation protein R